MFEFSGLLSNESKNFLYKKQKKLELLSIGSVCFVFSIPIVILAFTIHLVFLSDFFVIGMALFAPFLPTVEKGFWKHMPNRILIDTSENTILYQSEKSNFSDEVSNISVIYDYGKFYHIKFNNTPDSYYILQKDLIVKGTIQEFEEYFNDIIVKKSRVKWKKKHLIYKSFCIH